MSRALLAALMLACLAGCTPIGPAFDACEPYCDEPEPVTGSHNAAGGYRDACGALPGMLGDDC